MKIRKNSVVIGLNWQGKEYTKGFFLTELELKNKEILSSKLEQLNKAVRRTLLNLGVIND